VLACKSQYRVRRVDPSGRDSTNGPEKALTGAEEYQFDRMAEIAELSRTGDTAPSLAGAGARSAAEPIGPTILEVVGVTHRFDDVVALDGVSIVARQGEFLTILGQSGSGKTTLLRIISGLEIPTQAQALRIAGRDVRNVPAADRNCTTVFQHYALFPHMSVGENVEYGLKVRGLPKDQRRARALETLELVRLEDKYGRRVHQLSGGERQRVALARALVTRPAILLLDEPLGALDEKLRLDMQVELLELHRQLGVTFVYITHSQEEALTMSDRVVLMRRGRIVQEGPPRELFERPINRFVADFMGVENLLEGSLRAVEGERATVQVRNRVIHGLWCGRRQGSPGNPVAVGVRAERIFLGNAKAEAGRTNQLPGRPETTIYKGKYLDQSVETEVGTIKARIWDSHVDVSGISSLWWAESDCMIMPQADPTAAGISSTSLVYPKGGKA
jgi:spermidine/putrescine transport system ATP-binding protein